MTARFWLLLVFLLALTAVRLFLATHYELAPDEAYYYLWSQHPDICYYSKGPGVAMAILASTSIFGRTELGVRFLSPLLGLGTSLILYFLARHLYREKVAFWTVIGLNVLPIFNVGAIVMTIDPLSIFFWAAAIYTFWLALERSPAGLWLWLVTGLLIGLGFISKYTNAFQLLSVFLFLLMVPKHRRELVRPGFYLLLLGFLPFLLPPIIWNQQHEWITLAHLSLRGGLQKPFAVNLASFARFLGGQLGVYSPLIFIAFLMALFGSIRKAFQNTKVCFLLAFSWPVLITYLILALKQPGEPNWTAQAFVSLGILTTSWWLNSARENRAVTVLCVAGLVTAAFMTVIALDLDLLRVAGLRIPYRIDPSSRLRGWQTLAEQIEKFRSEFERKLGEPVFLIGNKYQTASMLSFYLKDPRIEDPGHPPVYIPESQDIQNEFSFWPRYDEFIEPTDKTNPSSYFTEQNGVNPFINRTALYITDHGDGSPPQALQNSFTRWELVAVFQLERRELPLREIRVFACYQYQTLPL
jgi:hypothetical protein